MGDGAGSPPAASGSTTAAAVIVRAIPGGSLEQVIFRVDALHRLARLGVAVINSPRCIERTVDKYFTSTLLEDAGLPTPRTRVCERFDDALAAFEALGGDVVVKPLFGSEGRGIVRVSDPDLAYRTCRALELTRSVFYLQEFVPHGGRDIRAFVVGGPAGGRHDPPGRRLEDERVAGRAGRAAGRCPARSSA